MSVIEVRRLTKRGGDASEKSQRGYTQTYLVTTDDKQDGPLTVLASGLVPQVGDVYQTDTEIDLGARAKSIKFEDQDGDPYKWRVVVEYGSHLADDPDEPEPEDPGEREPRFSVRFEKTQVPVQGAYSTADPNHLDATTAIKNSAGQFYNPAPTKDETRPTIVLLVDEESLNLFGACDIQDTVNSDDFAGFPAKTLKLNVTNVQERYENGQRWWRKTYELAYKRDTWDMNLLDHGTLPDEEGNMQDVLLKNGSKTTGAPQFRGPYSKYRKIDFASHAEIPTAVKQLDTAPA